MKKEERSYLEIVKHSNGMDYDDAKEGVRQFENSQIQFKILKKELKKRDTKIRKLESQLERIRLRNEKKQEILISKQKKNLGKEIFSEDMAKEEEKKVKQWKKFMNRIENNMIENKAYSKKEIKSEFMVPSYTLSWCLNNLIKQGIINIVNKGRYEKYIKT